MKPHPRVAAEIPEHLQPYIAKQDASLYTPIDHAAWRFILKISQAFFSKHAHQKYLDGLKETGISTERIPLIEEMDEKLRRFGWRAVPVSGFIPTAAFMEFQSLGILPIACEMRKLEHLAYTPAPDIVHEAAGHAPIIADPEYAAYLRAYGEISRKAIFSSKDMAVYKAIRALSDTKENPKSTPEEIANCEKNLNDAIAAVTYDSEATELGRMAWWSTEYGLVGPIENPKIYGAGLLSSVGESYHCLSDEVKKVPFTLDCKRVGFDITRPQPQLFVTSDFKHLTRVLEEMAATMAFRLGGKVGLDKAVQAETVNTIELETGIQISGVLGHYLTDSKGEPCFLKLSGPCQLAVGDEELPNQGPPHHPEGFSTPLGKFTGLNQPKTGAQVHLQFESGIEVLGTLTHVTEHGGRPVVLTFTQCTVRKGSEILFRPEWGTFDMACGTKVISVFGGAADRGKYVRATGGFDYPPSHPKTNLTEANRALNGLYAQVRHLRESGKASLADLSKVHDELEKNHREDWLLRMELLELNKTAKLNAPWELTLRNRLAEIAKSATEKAELIGRGLELV